MSSYNWWTAKLLMQKQHVHIFILFISFHPPSLNAWFFRLEHQWVFEPSVIVAYESLSCPQCEKMDLKTIQSLLERVQMHKNAGKPKNCGSWRIFVKTADSLTVQDKQGTHEQLSLTKNTAVDHSANNTVLRIKGMQTFERGHFYEFNYYFLLWIICKHLYVNLIDLDLIQVSTK